MRFRGHLVALLLSCIVCGVGGWWLASSPQATGRHSDDQSDGAGHARARLKPEKEPSLEIGMPLTFAAIERKMLAQASTADLWAACMRPNDGAMVADDEADNAAAVLIFQELVDRLGWVAWEEALALKGSGESKDRIMRGVTAAGILACLARQDPWRAFETWRDHHKDFRYDYHWGRRAMKVAMEGLGQVSADAMIEMMKGLEGSELLMGYSPDYRPDFDFAAVMNFMASQGEDLEESPSDLLKSWGRQSPVAASQWLLAHVDFLERENTFVSQAGRLIREIGNTSPGSPGREEALEVLSHLSGDQLEKAWETQDDEETHRALSASLLDAATGMNQRETLLVSLFRRTEDADTLDPSWLQLAPAERPTLLRKMEEWRAEEDDLTPVQQEHWDRWRKRVTTAWGMAE